MNKTSVVDNVFANDHFSMNHINGVWCLPELNRSIRVYDPSTCDLLAAVPESTQVDVDVAVKAAAQAFRKWKKTDPPTRSSLLLKLADLVTDNAERIAIVEARDTGHYYRKALEYIQATPLWIRFHAGVVDKLRGASIPTIGQRFNFTRLEPLGVTAHIVPWNYPFLLYARSMMPALACGNTVVVKPAEQTPLSATLFMELMEEAGFPEGVINLIQGTGPEAGAALASHPQVNGITFTGSVATGKIIMQAASENVTRLNLELGGKSPNIIFPDAPLDNTIEGVTQAILSHTGQVCIAGSRVFVHEAVYDSFIDGLLNKIKQAKPGPLFEDSTTLGPLVSAEQLARVEHYVETAKKEGATLLYGGEKASVPSCEKGYYYLPTIFTDVTGDMTIACEEIFGPVMAILRWRDEDDLIRQTNDTIFGLAAGVWTRDIYKALKIVDEIEAGVVFVNDWFGELPWSPHGGYKQSGFGREEGLECIEGYTQVKNVMINFDENLSNVNWADAPL